MKMELNPLTPGGFLFIGGIVLVVLGLAGLTVLGPTPEASALGTFNWLDMAENVAHLVLGAVAIAASFLLKDATAQKYLVAAVGVIAALVAVLGFLYMGGVEPNLFGVSNMELSDDVLHAVVAVWAFAAAFGNLGGMMGTMGTTEGEKK